MSWILDRLLGPKRQTHPLDEPLWEAVRSGESNVAVSLLERGANIEVRDPWNQDTPLYYVCGHGPDHMAILLIDRGADVNVRCEVKATPLITAAYNGKLRVVKYLVEHGADIHARDKKRETALNYAQACRFPEARGPIVQYLLSVGAKV